MVDNETGPAAVAAEIRSEAIFAKTVILLMRATNALTREKLPTPLVVSF